MRKREGQINLIYQKKPGTRVGCQSQGPREIGKKKKVDHTYTRPTTVSSFDLDPGIAPRKNWAGKRTGKRPMTEIGLALYQ